MIEACFDDREDELIDQALKTENPWFDGITRERLEREGHVPLQLPVNEDGVTLPFSTAEWFRTPSGKGELTPVPVFAAPVESRGGADAVRVSAGVSAEEGGQLYELDVCESCQDISGWRRGRPGCWRCMRPMLCRVELWKAMRWKCSMGAGKSRFGRM